MQEIDVVAGVIIKDGKLILAKRKEKEHMGGKWEFPGGKMEKGETPFESLKREIKEELGIDVSPESELLYLPYRYPEKLVKLHFILARTSQTPIPVDCGDVGEFSPEEVEKLELADADREAWKKLKCIISSCLR